VEEEGREKEEEEKENDDNWFTKSYDSALNNIRDIICEVERFNPLTPNDL
jgi:hypothetical protein